MAETPMKPQKRILGDATMTSGNILPSTLSKKRKLETDEASALQKVAPKRNGAKSFGSSQAQAKSSFEEDLEKLTQDIHGLKENNFEKDQQWERPPLEGFDAAKDNLCFQQIDAEEGTFSGAATVKLFGVTQASTE
jgi:DNA polymerase delta subunit 1